MVSLEAVRSSNAKLKNFPPGLVALFVGATSGIGESTLKQFYRRAPKNSRVYFVGRNEDAANRIMAELRALQPEGKLSFIRKDLTLLKNVDEVCDEIRAKESKLNLLFMTQGVGSLKGRDETSEGIDRKLATNYYGRLRFAKQLLPLLNSATSAELARVVSVLGAGGESSKIDLDNLDLKRDFSMGNAATHAITMTSLAFEEAARANPGVSFVHAYPGYVKTAFMRENGALVRFGIKAMYGVLAPLVVDIAESGERHLYAATSGVFPARESDGGVEAGNVAIRTGSDGESGSGAYLVGWDGEIRAKQKALEELRHKGAGPKVWEHTTQIFNSVLAD